VASTRAIAHASEEEEGEPRPPLVLVVDDEEDTRTLYSDFFLTSGFRVQTAVDGEDALEKAFAETPDVIVMDLVMPVLDGCDATRLLKADARTSHVPVLALTGQGFGQTRARALKAGVAHICSKPCLPKDVLEQVRALLPTAHEHAR